jgi:hypothetical protein
MEIDRIFDWLQATPAAVAIRENDILFPWIECIHVLAIVLVVGTILIVDLRLLGIASRDRPVDVLLREVLPYTWTAFAVAAVSGSLLFSSNATKYAHNTFFQLKMMLLVIAAANMGIFHLIGAHKRGQAPLSGRAAGAISLLVWVGVIACGRWIGFTLH